MTGNKISWDENSSVSSRVISDDDNASCWGLLHPSIPSPIHCSPPQPRASGLNHFNSREVIKIMQTSLMWTWPILKPYRSLQTWLCSCCVGLLPASAYMTCYINIIKDSSSLHLVCITLFISIYCKFSAQMSNLFCSTFPHFSAVSLHVRPAYTHNCFTCSLVRYLKYNKIF